jgi:hypothetical protein
VEGTVTTRAAPTVTAIAFGFVFVVSLATVFETLTALVFFSVIVAAGVDFVATIATAGVVEPTVRAAVVVSFGLVLEAVATVGVLETATVGVLEAAAVVIVEATAGAASDSVIATAGSETPWLKFAANSLKSDAFTRPS